MAKRRGKSQRSSLLLESFKAVAKIEKYWNVWRNSEQWLEILIHMYPDLTQFVFTAAELNRALSVDPVLKHCLMNYGSLTNCHGIYFDRKNIKKLRITAIYCCEPNKAVRRPPTDKAWWETLATRTPSACSAWRSASSQSCFGSPTPSFSNERTRPSGISPTARWANRRATAEQHLPCYRHTTLHSMIGRPVARR